MKKTLVVFTAVGMLAGLLLSQPANAAVAPPNMTGLVIGADGALYTSIRRTFASTGGSIWDRPVPASPQATAPPGAGISAARFPDGNIAAFYVGVDGLLRVSYTTGTGQWQSSTPITVAGEYTPGAQVVTVKSPIGVDTVSVDRHNWIYVTRGDFRIPPRLWMGIPAPRDVNVPSGAPLSAQRLPNGELWTTFVDSSGALALLRLTSAGTWLTPTRLTNPGAAAAGSTVKMVLGASSVIIFWIDTAGFVHKMTPAGPNPGPDQVMTLIDPLPVTAGLSPVPLPNGQVALFFAGRNGAVNLLLTSNSAGQSRPIALTQTQIIPPGTKLELALSAGSSTGWYDIDGDLCPPPPWPWPGPWPPRGSWSDLAVTLTSSGSVISSQLRLIGLTNGVVTAGNVATVG